MSVSPLLALADTSMAAGHLQHGLPPHDSTYLRSHHSLLAAASLLLHLPGLEMLGAITPKGASPKAERR